MCGIVGYAGSKPAARILYEGLQKLEYRGYDSAGLSTLSEGRINTVKHSGRVSGLSGDICGLNGNIGIGHTRWATHGEATDENAHPHCFGAFSVVHNGIIENYAELKEQLVLRGETFSSQTDSEVVAHLLNLYYDGDLAQAVRKTVEKLRGSYALAILCRDYNGIIAVKYKSPVIVGYGDGGNFVASDIPALVGKARKITVLEDGESAYVTAEGVTVYDKDNNRVVRSAQPIVSAEGNENLNYPHYMIKEMNENSRTVRRTAEEFFEKVNRRKLKEYLRGADRVLLVGCGTAYNSALVAKRIFEKALGCFCTAEIASELRYDCPKVTSDTLVIAVSQSGETADTVEAASMLREAGAKVVAVTNVTYSAITRVAHLVVPVCAGSELCVAATKSYIGQLTCFHLMAALVGQNDVENKLYEVADGIDKVLSEGKYAAQIAEYCAQSSAVFFLGRGTDYDVAIEGSLKLKEVSYIFSDAYPAGELKHGTLALVDEKTLTVVVISNAALAEKSENAVEQVVSRRGRVAVITTISEVAERLKDKAEIVWLLPDCPADMSQFLSVTALQYIAYDAAVGLGHDPDKPRNLAKSVTVE